jgi:hypothetical protein
VCTCSLIPSNRSRSYHLQLGDMLCNTFLERQYFQRSSDTYLCGTRGSVARCYLARHGFGLHISLDWAVEVRHVISTTFLFSCLECVLLTGRLIWVCSRDCVSIRATYAERLRQWWCSCRSLCVWLVVLRVWFGV